MSKIKNRVFDNNISLTTINPFALSDILITSTADVFSLGDINILLALLPNVLDHHIIGTFSDGTDVEIVKLEKNANLTELAVTRGLESTTDKLWPAGTTFEIRVTAETLDDMFSHNPEPYISLGNIGGGTHTINLVGPVRNYTGVVAGGVIFDFITTGMVAGQVATCRLYLSTYNNTVIKVNGSVVVPDGANPGIGAMRLLECTYVFGFSGGMARVEWIAFNQ